MATAVRRLHGNPAKRPFNMHEPTPATGIPPRPSWLGADARVVWDQLTTVLEPMRVITQADGVLLEMIAVTYVRWKDAEAVLERDGLTFTSKTGYIGPRPEVAIARRAMQLLRQLIPEIGMTPSSRPGLVAAAHDDHVNAFDKFAKGPERPTC